MKTGDSNKSAAVLVFAVLLLAAGVFVLAGIAQLSATQALIGQSEWEALNRRMMLENSRAMARQFMLSKMFNSVLTNTNGYGFTNELGGFVVKPPPRTLEEADYWTTVSYNAGSNTNANLRVNPFTLMERGGFYRIRFEGQLQERIQDNADTTNWVEWEFQVRTRSPIAAGYPVVQQLPASYNMLSLAGASPYVDMNEPEQFVGFHDMARMRVSSVTNTNSLETNGYVGYFDVPDEIADSMVYQNSNAPNVIGAGPDALQDVLNLDSKTLESPGPEGGSAWTYRVPAFKAYPDADGNLLPVTSLLLTGTKNTKNIPLQIVIEDGNTNLRTVVLAERNAGEVDPFSGGVPVALNFYRDPNDLADTNAVLITTNSSSGPYWRIGISSQGRDLEFETGNMQIIGGVRTDVAILGTNPVIRQELDPRGLDFVADRMMWLEDYWNYKKSK